MNISQKIKEDWDRRANHDAKFWIATGFCDNDEVFAKHGEENVKQMLEDLKPYMNKSWHVLEIGCGIGRLLKPMSSYFEYVCGIDVSKEMISKSKEWLKGIDNVETFENNGVDLNLFTDSSFDFVFSFIAFQHMQREVFNSYMAEINRVLKPSGLLKFQICLGQYTDYPLDDTFSLRIYEEKELSEKLSKNGFKVINRTLINEDKGCGSWFILARNERKLNPTRENINLNEHCIEQKIPISEVIMYIGRAGQYINQNKKPQAISTLQELSRLTVLSLDVWLELVILLIEEQRVEEAIFTLKDMLKMYPDYQQGYVYLNQLNQLKSRYGSFFK